MIHILEKVANTGPLAYCGRVLAGNDRYYAGYTGHLATCPECLSHLCDGLQAQAADAASQLRMASID